MTPNSKYHIIVCAPPGGLAKQLSLLIDYAVNPASETPDWATPVSPDYADKQDILFAQSALDVKQLLGLSQAEFDIPVRFSSLSAETIRQQYSNCKIIQVVCNRQDYLQMAWNHVCEDQFNSMGHLFVDDYFINFVKNAHNDPDLDFMELLKDPQSYSDPRLTLLLNLLSRGHNVWPYAISYYHNEVFEPASQSFLPIDFKELCIPEHGNTDAAIVRVIDFLGSEVSRSNEVVTNSWRQLMKRLSSIEKTK